MFLSLKNSFKKAAVLTILVYKKNYFKSSGLFTGQCTRLNQSETTGLSIEVSGALK